MTAFLPLTNTPRDYAWGTVDGVSKALAWTGSGGPEAELWLGAHPLSPSVITGDAPWTDLAEWQQDAAAPLPFLLKVLSAQTALSLQAHPTPEQAREGFAREEAAGIPLTARERNYKDPNAKPELIVATVDGFEALCGFRDPAETIASITGFGDVPGIDTWIRQLEAGIRPAFTWLLSGEPEVAELVAAVTERAATAPAPDAELVTRLAALYPGDPGILTALMLNRVTLRAGEALWLPAGNIHAYLRGTGVELMGPSDNVLRGGLTPKHVDIAELEAVLDFTPGPPPHLVPVPVGPGVAAYRPASMPSGAGVDFELLLVDQDATVDLPTPAIALALEGGFELAAHGESVDVVRGGILFLPEPGTLTATGAGRLFIATGR
jgi:mannose-6-phosphate isomerase